MSRARPRTRSLIGVVGLVGLASVAWGEDWLQLAGTAARTGGSVEALEPGSGAGWSATTGATFRGGAVVSDGVLVAVDTAGTARGYQAHDGALRWTQALDARDTSATPAASRGRVAIALGDGRLVCLALETGSLLWQRTGVSAGPRAALAIDGTTVYASLGFPSRRLQAIDLLSGNLVWEQDLPQVAYSPPAVGSGIVVAGTDNGTYEARAAADGAVRWSYATTGRVLLSAPMLTGDSVFLLPGGSDQRLHRVDVDHADWGTNWTIDLPDPAPPTPAWAIMGTQVSTANPTWTGRYVVCLLRYDYTMDNAAPWWVADRHVSRERVYVVDPAGPSVVWSQDVAALDSPSLTDVPPFGVCPAPLILSSPNGTWVGLASSLSAQVVYRQETDGAFTSSFALGAGKRWARAASPAAADARIALPTDDGEVHLRALAGNLPPAAAAPATPDATVFETAQPTVAWSAALDGDHAAGVLTYDVRIDRDGEVLLDAEQSLTTAAGATAAVTPTPLDSDQTYTWRVRARDPKGARSPWSTPRSFVVSLVPEAPTSLTAAAGRDFVRLNWTASTSDFVGTYVVSSAPTGGAFNPPVEVGAATTHTVTGLTSGTSYTFRVWARSSLGKDSAHVQVSATPTEPVVLGGTPFPDLLSAIGSARPGDVIDLGAGTFPLTQTLVLPAGVSLRGAGAHLTRLAGTGLFPVLRVAGDASVTEETQVSALSIFGGTTGVEVEAAGALTLEHVVLYDNQDGLLIKSAGAVEAQFVTVAANTRRGVVVDDQGSLTLADSLVTRNDVGLVCIGTPAAFTTRYVSVATHTGGDRQGCVAGPTDLALEPLFRDLLGKDFRVLPGSPSIDQGDPAVALGQEPTPNGGRVNLGAYGATDQAATTLAQILAGAVGGASCSLRAAGPSSQVPLAWLLLGLGLLALVRRGPLAAG